MTCGAETGFTFPEYAALADPFPGLKPAGRGVSLIVDGIVIPSAGNWASSGGEAERIDVTTHDTPGRFREFRPSFASEMTGTFDIIYDPTHPAHQHLALLFSTGQVVPVDIQLWNQELPEPGSEIRFDGFVSAFPLPALPFDGAYTITVQMTITGEICFPGQELGPPEPAPALGGSAGSPGVWVPTGSIPPETLAELSPAIRPYPLREWVEGEFIFLGEPVDLEPQQDDPRQRAAWDGEAWILAPEEPTT